eukprot:TRINITY_DN54135_c0_g1_i1.p2 TRINITY_DN54135_c0_g1~~TRINITY_DN54135_c0_g1_i1.p2  ORF type:complete len:170 (+),score=22.89 TRINITY_DN54135_c0_g1_i1:60-569(+)
MGAVREPLPTGTRRLRVGVVGAGISGLRCGELLAEAGAEVLLLEARDRVGGRVANSSEGLPLGAAWVHGTVSNEVAMRLQALGVSAPEVTAGNPWMRPTSESIAAFLRIPPRDGCPATVARVDRASLQKAFDELGSLVREASCMEAKVESLTDALARLAVTREIGRAHV